MFDFILPNYHDGSIINLMSSISNNFEQKHEYKELPSLTSEELKRSHNVILLVIDGLGYEFLKKQKESYLFENLRTNITSTFISTTACANTAFNVGYPPQQHGLTGWDINLKEVGSITTILPFVPLFGKESLDKSNFKMEDIIDMPSFHKNFNAKCFALINKKLASSQFTKNTYKDMKIIPTASYTDTFTKLKKIINTKSNKRKFVHAYINDFDSYSHNYGINSRTVKELFLDLDKKIKTFSKQIKDTNTKLIIVADHGLIDVEIDKQIWVENIEGLSECLTIPLTGESRLRYCFVRPHKVKDFERIMKTKLSKYCWCYKGEELIKQNLYGLGKPNKKIFDRVGDYVLIMKDNYLLNDKLANFEKPKRSLKSHHGGVSPDEMLVPLIVLDC
ncbi:MAG: alkaline phosphatase family protein [DPANN group archaeon]|nr:alkaline phosphatase family protein [DPANN group archaeon]